MFRVEFGEAWFSGECVLKTGREGRRGKIGEEKEREDRRRRVGEGG